MDGLELFLLLLAIVAAVTLIARRVGIPAPILMVVAGLAIALVPAVPSVELDPDTVLTVFLPPILFSGAFFLSLRDLWRNIRPITLLAVGLVLITTLAVAVVAMALVPELGWPMALALGAIVSPPDAISATAIARRVNLPRRLIVIIEGESLVNDATALTMYKLAVAAAVGTASLDFGPAVVSFVSIVVGGVIVGLIVGWIAVTLIGLIDDPPVEILVSLLTPFVAYIPAELLGVSGVLATVVAGLLVGFRASRILRSEGRVFGAAVWQMLIFVVNGLAFLLVGLQLPTVLESIEGYTTGQLIGLAAAVCLTVIAIRILWVFPATYVPRWLIPGLARRDPAPPARAVLILGWGGMRGAVSLAAALALPLTTIDGDPLPGRGLVIFLAFAVILVTLVGQGLTLPLLIRRTGIVDDGAVEHEEVHARSVATAAALVRLEELRAEAPGHLPLIDQLKERYEHQGEHLVHEHPDDAAPDEGELTPEEVEELEHDEIRRSVIAAERLAVLELRDNGEISDDALRRVERDLDLDELRRET